MKFKTCCFTGHRDIPTDPAFQGQLQDILDETIQKLIGMGVRYFGTGGARGFDTMAALSVLKMREKHPDISLILVLPCVEQTRGWRISDVVQYNQIKSAADKVVYTSRDYTRGCMYRRNRHLVDNSDICVAYCTKNTGGTTFTVSYAHQKGIPVIQLAQMMDSQNKTDLYSFVQKF